MVYQYPLFIAPFDELDFSTMTKKQAQVHFDWFVSEVPVRLQVLLGAIKASGIDVEQFDMTPNSLVPLWDWVRKRMNIESRSQEEIESLRSALPDWIFTQVNDWKFDSVTLSLVVDVSLYLAEVFLRRYPNLHWGFKDKPQSDVYLNKPVVMGFRRGALHPPTVVVNLCNSYVEGNQEKNLLSLFEVWSKFI